ncbi:MAG TPA: CpsD/CapB family tyrosine-protein kinase [Candidatus Binatia bacterium]|jgi:capsular exopolysaccharide synthesis family protein
MSRVFEALEKASKEKAVTIPRFGDRQALREPVISNKGSFEPGRNGKDRDVVTSPGSWRERAEEVLFGRDLRSYKNFPLVALEKESPAADQYKILREQVRRLRLETGVRCLYVTSPIKRDGKSMVAANLATVVALDSGERVLLMDCDLRNPQIHQYFGMQRSPGITDYLTSTSNENVLNYVQESFLPNLQVLPAGKFSGLAAELLATEKMRIMMDEIRRKFPDHQIIIDGPPVLSTPDPLVMARQVDGVILVVRAGKTPRDCLSEAMEILKSDKIMGIVLNGAELGMTSKYYYYQETV